VAIFFAKHASTQSHFEIWPRSMLPGRNFGAAAALKLWLRCNWSVIYGICVAEEEDESINHTSRRKK
jgi:hypothetical protein